MANILAFHPVDDEPEKPSHRRLRLLSRALVWLFTSLVILFALYFLAAAIVSLAFGDYVMTGADGARIDIGPNGEATAAIAGWTRLSDQPLITRIAAVIDIGLAMAPIAFAIWHLRGLFQLYAAGTVFARQNARHLRYVGLALIAYPVAKFAANLIFRLAGGLDPLWFWAGIIYAPIAGAIILVIAQVMEVGHEIEQEKDSFL